MFHITVAQSEDSPVAMKLKKICLKTPVGEEQAAQAVLDPALGKFVYRSTFKLKSARPSGQYFKMVFLVTFIRITHHTCRLFFTLCDTCRILALFSGTTADNQRRPVLTYFNSITIWNSSDAESVPIPNHHRPYKN